MKNEIILSIIIATFNSEKLLPKILTSIRKQKINQEIIEILVMDGGSTDKTIEIAKRNNCIVINNPKTEPVNAKYLGYLNAEGKYVMYLDSDEEIERTDSLQRKIAAFKKDKRIKAIVGSGYKKPDSYSAINSYINEFGDPFSYYIYNLSKDSRFFLNSLKKKYQAVFEDEDMVAYDFTNVKLLPIIELVAMGSVVDVNYLKKEFPQIRKDPSLIPHFFYLLNKKPNIFAFIKNDPLIHYSADNFSNYLNKIRWRVKNNIYHKEMGASGFSGRQEYLPPLNRNKKYLFIPYAFSIVLPLWDSLYLSITRKNIVYLLHLPLVIFTASIIVYHLVLKTIGYHPALQSYGGSSVVNRK